MHPIFPLICSQLDTLFYLTALADYILDPFSMLDGSDIDG